MKAALRRIVFSIVTRNIATFVVILTLVVVPLVVRYLGDVEELKSETIRAELDAVAELGRFMLDAEDVAQVQNANWYGTPEHEQTLEVLTTIQQNFQVDNAVLMRRTADGDFVYIGDGNRQFEINQAAGVHQVYPATFPPAVTAWETGQPSETSLFETTDSSWFQVYTPLMQDDRVVALLLLNRFSTPVAVAIAERQVEILSWMSIALAGGIFVWWFITTRTSRPLLRLRDAAGEVAAGNLDVEIPDYQHRSEVGELHSAFRKMVDDLRVSRAEIEEYNRTLEQRISERTREVQSLLDNMDEGLLTVSADGTIHPRYSAATEDMLGELGKDANFVERVIDDPETRETVTGTFSLLLGGELMLGWDDMTANLPNEFQGEGGRWLKARYRPVYSPEGERLERIMIILRDVTQEKMLQQDIERNRERQTMVLQILQNRESFESFYSDSQRLLAEAAGKVRDMDVIRRGVVDEVFRTMHTVKGTAGLFGLTEAARLAHEAEDALRETGARRDEALHQAERNALMGRISAVADALQAGRADFRRLVGEYDTEPTVMLTESRIDRIVGEALAVVPQDAAERAGAILKRLKYTPTVRLLRKYQTLVETTAQRLGKQAELKLEDRDDTELPSAFFQRIDPTFLHLIRNALDHGVEDVEERSEAGKDPVASIQLSVERRNGGIVFTLKDDGRGVDLERVRSAGIEKGFIKPERAGSLSREDVLRLLLLPGFSSRDAVTDLSGRGVGLDVVWKDISQMHGRLRLTTTPGRGTAFSVYYPLSLS